MEAEAVFLKVTVKEKCCSISVASLCSEWIKNIRKDKKSPCLVYYESFFCLKASRLTLCSTFMLPLSSNSCLRQLKGDTIPCSRFVMFTFYI